MADYAVKILFPGLTADNKIYMEGEMEQSPGPDLIELTKSKEIRRHGDTGRNLRLAKFVRKAEEEFIPDEFDDIRRVPVMKELPPEDGLDEKKRSELIELASNLGAKKPFARNLKKPDLVKLVRLLRTF
jgi:hypothetical protein